MRSWIGALAQIRSALRAVMAVMFATEIASTSAATRSSATAESATATAATAEAMAVATAATDATDTAERGVARDASAIVVHSVSAGAGVHAVAMPLVSRAIPLEAS